MPSSLVVGCGFVGRELARRLVARGDDVVAVSRSGVSIPGVESLERDVTDSGLDLPAADRVFYLVSAGARSPEAYRSVYVDGLEHTIEAAVDETTALVYGSSTGVYETDDGSWVDEETPLEPRSDRSRVLLEAEDVARAAGGTAVRFGGLYGPGRLSPGRYLEDARVTSGYVNLVHRDDAAAALLVAADGDHDCYVAVDDEPAHRHEVARWLADYTGRPAGELVDDVEGSNKRCANDRLRAAGWDPTYPTFREGFAAVLGS